MFRWWEGQKVNSSYLEKVVREKSINTVKHTSIMIRLDILRVQSRVREGAMKAKQNQVRSCFQNQTGQM